MLVLTPPSDPNSPDWAWVRSRDGQQPEAHGQAPAATLPADPDVVLLVPPHRLSWHHVTCPKVPAARLRPVLEGLLEDRLLDDVAQLHLAVAPQARPGDSFWVAACDTAWLQAQLDGLQAAGRPVSRIAPLIWPQETPQALAYGWADRPVLALAGPHGVACLPLAEAPGMGSPPPPGWDASVPTWAEPAVAAAAEAALHQPPTVLPSHELALRAAQGPWNLAQFAFSRSAGAQRGQRLRETWRRLRHAPEWRPLRWGLVGLVLVQTAAINLQAWQERQRLAATQASIRSVLTTSFPQTRVVLDAPVQMQRSLSELRQRSGQVAQGDLETLLHHLGRAQAQFNALEFSATGATLRGFQTRDPQAAWQDDLTRAGWRAETGPLPTVVVLQPLSR